MTEIEQTNPHQGPTHHPSVRWRGLDARSLEATCTTGPHTSRAVLVVDDSGALVDFWSDDRPALAEDGRTMLPQRR